MLFKGLLIKKLKRASFIWKTRKESLAAKIDALIPSLEERLAHYFIGVNSWLLMIIVGILGGKNLISR